MERPYYSERSGETEPGPIDDSTFKKLFWATYRRLDEEGYFQTAFGYECVDEGYVHGETGMTVDEHLDMRFGSERNLALNRAFILQKASLPDVFDLAEYLFDHIAKPTQDTYHSFANCGLHVRDGSSEAGQEEWREQLNDFMERMDPPYRLTEQGRVERRPDEGTRQLVDEYEGYGDEENVDQRVHRACRQFFGRNASEDDRRQAIRELADVLEYLREEVEEVLPNWESNRLFEIANQYGIRHHTENQNTEYDTEAYYPWIFHSYLSTIHLISELSDDSESHAGGDNENRD